MRLPKIGIDHVCTPLEKILEGLLERGYRSEAFRDGDWQNGAPAGVCGSGECVVCQQSGRDMGKIRLEGLRPD